MMAMMMNEMMMIEMMRMRMIEMMVMITMWFCNNQSVKEAKGKAGGNPSRPEQTMDRAQHGKTEYKYSYTSRQDIQIFLH